MFENISTCENWQCINSFALWISSIGTVSVSVSIIALWLSMKDRFLRMNANFDTGRVSGEAPNILNKSVYILSFTNVGPRPITVTNYEWKLPLAKIKRCITFPNLDPSVTHLCTKFPTELTDGKGGIIFHANHFFRSMDDPEDFLYPKSYISAWLKIRFFKMYMSTSVGKKIKVKVHARVRQALWTEYKAINA